MNTCNEFTIQATDSSGANDPGETIDIRAQQSDNDTNQDLEIRFCNPGAADLVSSQADCDDNNAENDNAGNCTGSPAGITPTEAPASIHAQCVTDSGGQCTFGVQSDEGGTMTITAFAERTNTTNNQADSGEPTVTATKTWVAAGAANVTGIACTPETDNNPETSTHTITCTLTNAQGQPVSNVTEVFMDVISGPNSEEVNLVTCGGTSNAQGQVNCSYTDQGTLDNPNSPPGTDTIRVHVNNSTADNRTAGPDAGEPQDTVTKSWYAEGRVIDCEPETATNQVGTAHNVTCTVTDRAGNPVPNVETTSSFTGVATTTTASNDGVTNAQGQVVYSLSTTTESAAGTTNLTVRISGDASPASGPNQDALFDSETECARTAGDPSGAPAGVCSDAVSKTWTRDIQGAPECNDNLDNDDDGRVDYPADPDCAGLQDDSEAHTPVTREIATNLTIRYDANDNAWKGSVGSSRKGCQVGRQVTVKRVRPGKDAVVGRDTSNRRGSWQVGDARANGKYYAVVSRKVFTAANGDTIKCLRDRSVTIKI